MRRLALGFAALVLVSASFVHGGAPLEEARATLRHEVLRLINADRQAHGLRPVALDAEASALADAYCRQQIANGTTGHFTIDGLAPYMRYSFGGGNDGVASVDGKTITQQEWEAAQRRQLDQARQMMGERFDHNFHQAIF